MPRWIFAVLACLSTWFVASAAFAAAPLTCPSGGQVMTGQIDSSDPAQTGRFTRAANPASTCAAPKTGSPAQDSGHYGYDALTFKNRTASAQCMSITLESTSGGSGTLNRLQSAAYLGSFDPNDITQNYLGDSGPSVGFGVASITYEVNVASLADFVVVVTESDDGSGGTYKVTVQNCGEIFISSFAPSFGPTAGGNGVFITGAGFQSGATVTFGGTASSSVTVSDEFNAVAVAPAHAAGSVDLVFKNPNPAAGNGASATGPFQFTYYDDVTTSTTVSSSANPSVFGQTVTLTAHVTATGPTPFPPYGTVTFKDGATTLGTAAVNQGTGDATFDVSTLAVGSHPITAAYAQDPPATTGQIVFSPSSSSTLDQVVNKASTTTDLASSANPAGLNATVTFTATVTPVAPGAGSPSGTVHFLDNGVEIGSSSVSNGQATLDVSNLSVGTHPITAVYDGDGSFLGSSSSAVSQVIDPNATTITITASPVSPSTFGQTVTFTVTVSGGSSTPTGNVTFKDGSTVIGTTQPLDGSGQAQVMTSTLTVGIHTINVAYDGDGTHQSGTASKSYTVLGAGTTVALTSSVNPSAPGQSVTFTANVSSTTAGTISGIVTFKDGTTSLGTGGITSGAAVFSTTSLAVGSHAITAVYAGAGNFAGATSNVVNQVVQTGTDGGVDGGDAGGGDSGTSDAGGVDGSAHDGGGAGDSGTDGGGTIAGGGGSDSGCGCTTTGGPSSTAASGLLWAGVALLVARRRRRRS